MILARKLLGAGGLVGGSEATTALTAYTPTLYNTASLSDTNDSWTASLGTGFTGRVIWCCVTGAGPINTPNPISSVTIGGNSMTKLIEVGDAEQWSGSATMTLAYYYYQDDGALGTSATLTITMDEIQYHLGGLIFIVDGAASLLESYGGSADYVGQMPTIGSAFSSTSASGWSFAAANNLNSVVSGTEFFTNFSNDTKIDFGTNDFIGWAYNSPEDGSSTAISHPINFYSGSDTNRAELFISMEPA